MLLEAFRPNTDGDADFDTNVAILRALGDIGPDAKQAVPLLRQLIDDRKYVRVAAGAVEGIGPDAKEALPALIAFLEDPDKHSDNASHRAVLDAIGAMGPQAAPAVATLVRELRLEEDFHEWTRWCAASALKRIGPAAKTAAPALVEALDNEGFLRLYAVRALLGIGAERDKAISALTDALTSDKPYIRQEALHELAEQGPSAGPVVKNIIPLLQDGSEEVRCEAARTLGFMPDHAEISVPGLEKLLDSKEQIVVLWGHFALARLHVREVDHVEAIRKMLADSKVVWIRTAAVEALGALDPLPDSALPELAKALKDEAQGVRVEAANVFEGAGSAASAALPALRNMLEAADEYHERVAAYRAIREIERSIDGNGSRSELIGEH